jgi:hypothetical protein
MWYFLSGDGNAALVNKSIRKFRAAHVPLESLLNKALRVKREARVRRLTNFVQWGPER